RRAREMLRVLGPVAVGDIIELERNLGRRQLCDQRPRLLAPPLLFRLHAATCISSSHETDDLALGSRSGNTASGRPCSCRRTWNILAGLVGDELVEICVREHPARALAAVADADVTDLTGSDVSEECFD